MEITRAYLELIKRNFKNSYIPSNGKLVYNQHYSWLVVFEATNKYNYAVVKFYNGRYEVIEM
jgi:hypothetical protein